MWNTIDDRYSSFALLSNVATFLGFACFDIFSCHYHPPAFLLPTVLVNIIVVVVYFYPRLRIRYPEFILVATIVISEARYKTLHSTSHNKVSEWVGSVDTASSYEPEGRGFESHLVF